jgi:glycosyltransferase involved in cell wall biosynthesis/protein-tyrosine-phosphatase
VIAPPARHAGVESRIRVCHVMSADLWAGAEVQLATLMSYLAGRGELELSAVLMNDGRLARELRRAGVRVEIVDERHNHAGRIVNFLADFLRRHRVDIVHTHRYKDTLLGFLAARLAEVPHAIRTLHGLPEPVNGVGAVKYGVLNALDRFAMRHFADAVIAVSRNTADALARRGHKTSAIQCIHNGVDTQSLTTRRGRGDVRRELQVGPETLLVGTAGRLVPVKAHDDLIRAIPLILQRRPDARFLIAGDGPLDADLKLLARELGVESKVMFPGDRDDVHDLIAAMDVFALPSLSEGTPMALLEAMALGTPVVATSVGGVPEVISHPVNGLLVPPQNPQALADACLDLDANRERALTMAAHARRTIEESFSRDANGRGVMNVYRAVSAATAARTRTEPGPSQPSTMDLCRALAGGLVRYVRARCHRASVVALQRQRMRKLRRNPARLTSALRSARRILIVCHGNIIRSPFAARLAAQALERHGRVSVMSAGLGAVPGCPPHPTAALIATARSVDLSDHAASPLDPATVAASDVIFVMDVPQLIALRERFPEAASRTFLLACLSTDTPLEIGDPVDGDESRFRLCFDDISSAVRPIVRTLCGADGVQ